jgi:DNA modification methylase
MFLYHAPVHDDEHPCPYPVSLAQEVLEHIAPSDGTVLDPYLGSGSTAIAAWTLGMNTVGIDLDCDRAIARCSDRNELERHLPSPQLSLFA